MSSLTSQKDSGVAADPSFQRLLNCLEQIRHKLDSREDDFLFLSNYFQSKDFRKLFKVHSTVLCSDDGGTSGVKGGTAVELAQEVAEALRPGSHVNKEVQELEHILTKPHIKGLLQAHDLIAAGDFTSTPPEEVGTEILLFNLNDKPETVDNEHQIIPVGNFEKDETKDIVNNGDDYGGNDRSDDDDDDDDDDGDDDDGDGRSGDQTEVTDKDDHYETNDTPNCENTMDSDSSSSSIPDNKHVMIPRVRVHVTDTCMGNSNADSLWWDVSASDTNTEESATFQAPVFNHNDVSEIQGATKNVENVTSVVTIDIKEKMVTEIQDGHMVNGINDREKDIDIKEGKKEKVIKDGYKRNDVEDGQKSGVPFLAVADNAAKTVRLFRNAKETLGITVKVVKNAENTESVVVARILTGGLAHTFGALHIDDEILEINGRRVEGMTANEVADIMDGITGSVDVQIVPLRKDRKLTRETKVSLRAFFDYNPLQDPLIPCKEVGVAFCTGDVLHVVNMDDAKWWQARKEGCSHDKAGLIPSKDFQEKRQQFNKISSSSDVSLQEDKNGRRALPFWRKRKNDSNKVLCNFLQEIKMSDCPAYEPVARYLETSEKKRLLLLIGASGVGRNELKKMLLSTNPDKFITTVPHTSRHMKSYETDGREYFFVSRQTMENFIQKRKFIEFGEFKGCLYGTSKDSIKKSLKTGKTCVLKVQPEVMLLLRTAEFKPYCIFIKPPSLKELRASRLTVQPGKAKRPSNTSNMRTFKEEDLQEMISASRELEENYGKFFDLTVVNKDTEEAYNSIVEAVERLELEVQWVPQDWVQKT